MGLRRIEVVVTHDFARPPSPRTGFTSDSTRRDRSRKQAVFARRWFVMHENDNSVCARACVCVCACVRATVNVK